MPQDLKDVAEIVYKLGFPVFVAIYLLTAFQRDMNKLLLQNQEALGLLRDIKNALFRVRSFRDE